jgi:hypothetical protein
MTASYKIAVLNCYLQAGLKKIAESEAFIRFQIAAKNLGHEARMFARSEDIADYNPDFVICHSYQDPKLTKFTTYGTLTMPVEWVANVERFVRNIGTYDAYITMSPSVVDYVNNIVGKKFNKHIPHIYSAFSVQKTKFTPLDFKNAHAAYIGTNWDGSRHDGFFLNFKDTGLLKCYGPREKWGHLSLDLYGGEVPFDGKSFLKTYQNSAVGLCFSHKDFDLGGLPTSRTFEIPASSALIIAGNNKLTKELYGDTALYVNPNCTEENLSQQVVEKVLWIRNNPHKANEMAEAANKIFNEKVSMEVLLNNLIKFHEENFYKKTNGITQLAEKKIRAIQKLENVKIAVISILRNDDIDELDEHLSSIANQDLKPHQIILVYKKNKKKFINKFTKNPDEEGVQNIAKKYYQKLNLVLFGLDHKESDRSKIDDLLQRNLKAIINLTDASYINFSVTNDSFYPNHFYEVASHLQEYKDEKNIYSNLVYSGAVECSKNNLPELLSDIHMIKRKEKIRIKQFGEVGDINLIHLHQSSIILKKEILEEKIDEADMFACATNQIFSDPKKNYTFLSSATIVNKRIK